MHEQYLTLSFHTYNIIMYNTISNSNAWWLCSVSEEVGTGSQNHMTYGQDFLQAGSFWLPRQKLAGLFLEMWTLLANFAMTSDR